MTTPSEKVIKVEAQLSPKKEEKEGFFSLLAKNFKKQSKELKLAWKKNSFFAEVSNEIEEIISKEVHFFEKKSMLAKIFSSLISFFPDNKSEKSASSSNEQLSAKNYLSSKEIFSDSFDEISLQIFGPEHLKFPDKAASPDPLPSPSRPQGKVKPGSKFEERDSRERSQESMSHYQQALGTLIFDFERNLVNFFKGHYKMVKKCYAATGQFSLFGARRNLLK